MCHLKQIFNTKSIEPIPSIETTSTIYSVSEQTSNFIRNTRSDIKNILNGKDDRLLMIIGPCSIHDPIAGLEYAQKLAVLQRQYKQQLLIVMRTYFEKPRTRTGWKGLIIDPSLNDSKNIASGLLIARKFLTQVTSLGVPTATEFLDTNIAPYIADLICWGAIGARTAESQPHRQLASALLCPIGIKNSTDGNINVAIDAIHAAKDSHMLPISGSEQGPVSLLTKGNAFGHVILRGGKEPNYASEQILAVTNQLKMNDLNPRLIVDCSHGNSRKIALNQLNVALDVAKQIARGKQSIAGVMCESFLIGGAQKLEKNKLNYGQSITDECLSWHDSIKFLEIFADAVSTAQSQKYSTLAYQDA